jgi:hypothetical protein
MDARELLRSTRRTASLSMTPDLNRGRQEPLWRARVLSLIFFSADFC